MVYWGLMRTRVSLPHARLLLGGWNLQPVTSFRQVHFSNCNARKKLF